MLRFIFLILVLFNFLNKTFATTHTINAGNFYFSPNILTINNGDTVIWLNDQGWHDVNFDINSQTGVSFGNPESFQSAASGNDTLYIHVFNIAGLYNYDCSVGSGYHASAGMVGLILVNHSYFLESIEVVSGDCSDNILIGDVDLLYDISTSTGVIQSLSAGNAVTQSFPLTINLNNPLQLNGQDLTIDVWDEDGWPWGLEYCGGLTFTPPLQAGTFISNGGGLSINYTITEVPLDTIDSWNCFNEVCVDPQDGSGTYSTLADCENDCNNNTQTPATNSQWIFGSLFPFNGVHHPITFSNDSLAYVVSGSYTNNVYKYTKSTDSWSQLADFPGGNRGYSYGVTVNDKAYMGLGSDEFANYYTDWWEFDMTTETWTQLSSLPGLGRNHPAMIATSDKIFMGCGSNDMGNFNDWWEYDVASDSWTQKPDLPSYTRHHPFYFGIDNEVYVGFGHGSNPDANGYYIYKDFYKYLPTNDQWIQLNDFPSEARVAGTQFSYNGKGYVLSGDGDNHQSLDSGEFWEYEPSTDQWTQLPSHPGNAIWAPGCFVIGCDLYFLLGQDNNTTPGTLVTNTYTYKLSEDCGCMDPNAINFSSQAIYDDGSCCYISGCSDPNAINFDSNVCFEDISSCIYPILGCNDTNAVNYNPNANTTSCVGGIIDNDSSSGGYFYGDQHLILDVYEECVIKSAIFDAEVNNTITFELRDANGNVLDDTTHTVSPGMQPLILNFDCPVGTDLQLGTSAGNTGLFRNNTGANYPYDIGGALSITESSAGTAGYYYYYYNIQVEVPCVQPNGCTDSLASNFDALATIDDGSCTYTAVCLSPSGLNIYDVVHTRATFNLTSTGADYYKIRVKENGGAWQVITQLGTATGTPGGSTKTKYFLTADASYEWQVRAWCIDGSISGWSSSAFFNTLPECPNATNQNASDIEAEWAVLNWDAPTNTVAGVNYYLARIQEQGASSWNIVSPGNAGTDNFKLKGQLIPGATYNFETRTWCNTGDTNNPTDPYYKSDWGGSASFTTVPCPVQTFNLYTSNVNATTQFFGADFIADGSVPYNHFTLRFREVGATAWTFRSITAAHIAAGGRNVGALTTGAEYEWGIRTFCGTGSTWKSPWESGPNFVAGSSARLAAPVTALEVYPNPSRDIFNISFTSEKAQTIRVKVVNVIGEVMYSESLEEFTGSYENSIDLTGKAKGVYFLEITTNIGGVNKKIVLQ